MRVDRSSSPATIEESRYSRIGRLDPSGSVKKLELGVETPADFICTGEDGCDRIGVFPDV